MRKTQRTRSTLDGLTVRQPIREWLHEVADATSTSYYAIRMRRDLFFAMKVQPPKNQPFLITLTSLDDLSSERVILDPNQLNPGGTTAIDFYAHQRWTAATLPCRSPKEAVKKERYTVYEVATGEMGDAIPRVNKGTGGGSVAWNGDGSGFFYTRYPADDERPKQDLDFYQQIYFQLGTPVSTDTYSIGREFPRIAETLIQTSDDGRYALAQVANGDGGEFAYYLRDLSGGGAGVWTQVAQFSDKITHAALGKDQALYLLSVSNAPRGKVLRLPLRRPALADAETVVPQSDTVIRAFSPSATLLYVVDSIGGPSRVRVFDQQGHAKGEVPTLPTSAVYEATSIRGDDLLF